MGRCLILVVSVAGPLVFPAASQDAPVARATNTVATRPAAAPQPPPLPSSPWEYFRKVLAMSPEEREKELATRTTARDVLRNRLKEFDELPADEREHRLRTFELRWYLLPLMRTEPTNRAPRMQMIPEKERALIERRLRMWDKLPANVQSNVLESEPALAALVRPENTFVSGRMPLSIVTGAQRLRIEQAAAHLSGLPEEKRQQTYDCFKRVLELSDKEKEKTLERLSEAERKQMQRTLDELNKLSPDERNQCISGFDKFRALSPQEREEFLRNAERWQTMSPQDRRVWRALVSRKVLPQPPSPPGLRQPTAHVPEASEPQVATNR